MITLDDTTDGGTGTTSLTFAHTCSGNDRLLVVAVDGALTASGDLVTGITYAGDAMTRLFGADEGGRWFYLYYLLNPDTGSNNVIVSNGGSDYTAGYAASYANVLQTGQPDATSTADLGVTTTPTRSITTVANDCVLVGVLRQATNFTADSGTTELGDLGNAVSFLASSGPSVGAAGSHALSGTQDSHDCEIYIVSFAPVPTSPSGFFALL